MTHTKSKILIIDDEAPIRDVLSASLQDEGFEVECAANGEEGIEKIKTFQPLICLLDIWMPGKWDGLDVLKEVSQVDYSGDFIVMSGHGNIETAVKATKLGAWDFVEKPLSIDKIVILINNLLAYQTEKRQKLRVLNKLRRSFSIIGESSPTVKLKEEISKIAPRDHLVFIQGENGAGKSLIAQHIHYFSGRAYGPFLEVNVSLVGPDLVATELFGAKAGFYVGSKEDVIGKIALAHEGSLYIREIDSLPLESQERLLLYLQTNKIKTLGSDQELHFNTRILISHHQPLEDLISQGKFSRSLFDYIHKYSLLVPPLRERKEDIKELVDHFKTMFEQEGVYRPKKFTDSAYQKLLEHSWPGNVRELRNFIERIFILIESPIIGDNEVQIAGISHRFDEVERMFDYSASLREARTQFEREFILKKLEENDGNISKTAEIIGVERSHLHRKIKSYGIDV